MRKKKGHPLPVVNYAHITVNTKSTDLVITDKATGKPVFVIPAGQTGYFYESKKKVRRKR